MSECFRVGRHCRSCYLSGRSYYLLPDAPVGQWPYGVLHQAMRDENRHAVAQVVLHGREQTVLLRPMDNVLLMTVLNLENEINKPTAYEDLAPKIEPSSEEVDLTKKVIELSTAKEFDFAAYKDTYTEKLSQLIEAKAAGKEITAAPAREPARIINLMDALRASVAKAEEKGAAEAKPPKKMAPSKSKQPAARKRKSS